LRDEVCGPQGVHSGAYPIAKILEDRADGVFRPFLRVEVDARQLDLLRLAIGNHGFVLQSLAGGEGSRRCCEHQ